MILIVLQFATQFANHQNATLHALNQKTPFATSNAKNLNVKLNVPIKDVKCLTAQSALLYANNHTVLPTAKHLNQNVNQFAKNQNATGNVINLLALNPNVNLFVKIQIVFLKLNAALVL
jgi:hypothetical protein